MSTQPQPCPFCGSVDLNIESDASTNQYVVCCECNARGPSTCHKGIEVVTVRWNDRVVDPVLEGVLSAFAYAPGRGPEWYENVRVAVGGAH